MHKWKDKVELSLDNRQIFFLFFGVSVVGCFVFALGVMVGRKLDWEPEGRGEAVAEVASLDLLGDAPLAGGAFTFKDGLAESAAADLPQTRDPEVPPRDEAEVKAEKAALEAVDADAPALPASTASKPTSKPAGKPTVKPAAAAAPKAAPAAAAAAAASPTLASGASEAVASSEPAMAKGKREFTLQIKAFSDASDANSLADKLRSNGHDVRVDPSEVRGRTWHRVRIGAFSSWDDAVAAKAEFEKQEKVIAYVMSK
jgi:cell division septation protein DedD